jgi:predicted alpha-1,2-mannosidase
VNPFIGTGGHGHTFPGATVPFGMVQLSPDTRMEGWDACAGYHYSDDRIYGFSHTHLSGTGIGDYCDILFLPMREDQVYSASTKGNHFYFPFQKTNESAFPGYYSVFLDEADIFAELTSTARCGFHRYTYSPYTQKMIVTLNLDHYDKTLEKEVKRESETEYSGKRISQGWAKTQYLYFYVKFSEPVEVDYEAISEVTAFQIKSNPQKQVLMKVGISAVSVENAKKNLEAEIPDWDFDNVQKSAEKEWEKYLNRIQISGNKDEKTNFYTALYHALIAPNLYQDVTGDYRGLDNKVYQSYGFNYHTVFSLWDTYRALHPLLTIVCPEKVGDLVNSMLDDFDKTGHLPVWSLAGNETYCMIGNHAIPVIADACMKGIKGVDPRRALNSMLITLEKDRSGMKKYGELGFLPTDAEPESVSKTLEYAYDDWCVAQLAQQVGDNVTYQKFIRRCQSYKNLFDYETKMMRPKMQQSFIEPFDPREVNFHFTEANAWQYAFTPVHDLEGWAACTGGYPEIIKLLDNFFNANSKTTGRQQDDITGLIGQYAHGNEPSHHIPYLYTSFHQPWKTQKRVSQIMRDFYKNTPEGLIGNDDCGQLSAWYVFSALGFYPLNPCGGTYIVGAPSVDSASIRVAGNTTFKIEREKPLDGTFLRSYIARNDTLSSQSSISHKDILGGKKLCFRNTPFDDGNVFPFVAASPFPAIDSFTQIVAAPMVKEPIRSFAEKMTVTLIHNSPDVEIFYTTDSSEPLVAAHLKYQSPFTIDNTTTVKFRAMSKDSVSSNIVETTFFKQKHKFTIHLDNPYKPQYAASGTGALVDGIRGGSHFATGGWQGFQGNDLSATIDLGGYKEINKIGLSCLQDQNSWIFFPTYLELSVSEDGKTFTKMATKDIQIKPQEGVQFESFDFNNLKLYTKFIKIVAKTLTPIPAWHKAKGYEGFIFADEITIE